MDIFIPFPVDGDQLIRKRLTQSLGIYEDSTGSIKDFVAIFNHDVKALNNLLGKPPSIYTYQKRALKLQKEYNSALEDSQKRWENGEKGIELGSSVIKNLSERKKRFQNAMAEMEAIEHKTEKLIQRIQPTQRADSFWSRLETICQQLDAKDNEDFRTAAQNAAEKLDELDNGNRLEKLTELTNSHESYTLEKLRYIAKRKDQETQGQSSHLVEEIANIVSSRSERLRKLRLDWQSQNIFVLSSSEDLITIEGDLKSFKKFLGFIEKQLHLDESNPQDKQIQNIININKTKLNRMEEALIQAMSWRIHAASLKKDMHFDDNEYALIHEIRELVFFYDLPEDLASVFDLLSIPEKGISKKLNFTSYEYLLEKIKQSNIHSAISKWKQSKWIADKDKQNFIPVELRKTNVIPRVLSNSIPREPTWTLGGWIRYWYFQTSLVTNNILTWFRMKFLGGHSEFISLMNETIFQMNSFYEKVKDAPSQGKSLNLYYLINSPAFRSALEAPEFIEREKLKGRSLKPSWTFGVLLSWIPFFNRSATYQFFLNWESIINQAQEQTKKTGHKLAEIILNDFENRLFESIKKKIFLLPSSMLEDIFSFINRYGDQKMITEYQKMIDPINILKKFKFLHAPNDQEDSRRLNEDSVHSFLSFASKYWNEEQYIAAKEIAAIILRQKVPASNEDLTHLFHKTKVLFRGTQKEEQFMQFLAYIAQEYIFLTGDQGDDESLWFLKRFYPQAAKNWLDEREENLDDKYIFIHSLLDVNPNFEKDINQDDVYDAGQIKLEYRLIPKYIQDLHLHASRQSKYIPLLLQDAAEYVQSYQGGNSKYREIILALSKHQPILIQNYLSSRWQWLFFNTEYQLTEEDFEFYTRACRNTDIQEFLARKINESFNGESNHLDELIEMINHPNIKGIYLAKRLQYLLSRNSYQEILDTQLFDDLAGNYEFIKSMNQYFDRVVQTAIEHDDYKLLEGDGFCHMIERFGSKVNKEAYRILRLKRLLYINDLEHTQVYINTLLPYVKDLKHDLITLEKGKELLVSIYQDFLEELEQKNGYSGHLQYLLTHFSMDLCPELLQRSRLLWLKMYLFEPHKFSDLASLDRPTLDLKFHHENLLIPNEEADLKAFYGEYTQEVADLVNQRLDYFSDNLNDSMIRLLTRYLKDPSLRVLDKHHVYRKKMEDFKRGQQILHTLQSGDYEELFLRLDHFIEDYNGQKKLLSVDSNEIKQEIVENQEKLLENIKNVILDQIEELFISPDQVFADSLDYNSAAIDQIMNLAYHSRIDTEFKEKLLFLKENRAQVHEILDDLYENLNIDSLNYVALSSEEALLLRDYLSNSVKNSIARKLEIIFSIITDEDPLFVGLNALKSLLTEKELSKREITKLTQQIENMQHRQRRLGNQVETLATEICGRLESGDYIYTLPLFHDRKSLLQITFIKALQNRTKQKMVRLLLDELKQVSEADFPKDELITRKEWLAYAMLIDWLKESSRSYQRRLAEEIDPLVEEQLKDAQENFASLQKTMDEILNREISNKEVSSMVSGLEFNNDGLAFKSDNLKFNSAILNQERELLKSALFVRAFGSVEAKEKLDTFVLEVLKRLRIAMMKGRLDPFREHCIKFADKVVSIAGNENQRQECARLMNMWNRFITQDQMSIHNLRSQAVQDTIPAFLEKFDQKLYQYFINKYTISPNFIQDMNVLLNKWTLEGNLVDGNKVLEKHRFSEFKRILKKHQNCSTWQLLCKRIDDRAAQKLYFAFCLSLQAHELGVVLNSRIQQNKLLTFNTKMFDDVLSGLMEKLNHQHKFKSRSFSKHFNQMLHLDQDYFVSWALDEETAKRLESDHSSAEIEDSAITPNRDRLTA